ncbi:MAG: hypothetical protein IKV36_02030 [Clostridia bacterium]|nr:hypothetical protein [Clostridia bacterium]
MKALKIIGNIFGILFSIILSIVLLAVIIVSPVFTAASDLVKPETIHTVIKNIDYEKFLVDNGIDVENSMSEYGIPADAISNIMETEAVGSVVELYVKEVEAALAGDMDASYLNADAIKQIANENIDDLVNIAFQFIPEEQIPQDVPIETVKEDVKTGITEYVNTNAEEIVSYLPDVKEVIVQSVDTQVIETIRYVQNGTLTAAVWITIAVLSLLIYGCRWPRFKGFMWLGVVNLLGTAVTFALGSVLTGPLLEEILASAPEANVIAVPAIGVVQESIIKVGIILSVLTVLFIAAFIVGRVFLAKRKKAAATVNYAPVTEAPAVEEFAQAEETAPVEQTLDTEEKAE